LPGPGLAGTTIVPAVAALLALVATVLVALTVSVGDMVSARGGAPGTAESQRDAPSALALEDIPPIYLRLYEAAADRYGLNWALLAGVGKVECDHGRDPDPSCMKEGAVNAAGAGGPMQFLAATWARYGVDGNGDGVPDRWNPVDAIYSAANYLHATGAPANERAALLAYNHAAWYVREVQAWAARYRGSSARALPMDAEVATPGSTGADLALASETSTRVVFTAGERAELAPGDGRIALVPSDAPWKVQAMIVAANELQELPYGPGGHPDPRGVFEEDCSSTVNYVLYRAGIRAIEEILRDNPLAQDYVGWGAPGPGRWVTIYAADVPTPHVFITIASLRLDTSHTGTDVGPNSAEDGPRWRILDHIPSWANWSVRHPPGL
jgi:hypothetical protein